MLTRTRRVLLILTMSMTLAGCSLTVPADPDGTLEAVSGGELRVGVAPDERLADVSTVPPAGPLVDLVDDFAVSLDADVQWTVGSEEELVVKVEEGDLDLVVGGFTGQTPWVDRVGVTRGYRGIEGAEGRSTVMFVPLGENAFLSSLEAFLDTEVGR